MSWITQLTLWGKLYRLDPVMASHTWTEKSPDADPARHPVGSKRHDHTAPL